MYACLVLMDRMMQKNFNHRLDYAWQLTTNRQNYLLLYEFICYKTTSIHNA